MDDDDAYTEQLLLEHPGMRAHLQVAWPDPDRLARLRRTLAIGDTHMPTAGSTLPPHGC